jgi:hypothetical protein
MIRGVKPHPSRPTTAPVPRIRTSGGTALAVALASLLVAACGGTTDPAPVIASFSASPSSAAHGTPITLEWSVSDATSLSIDPGVGAVTGTTRTVAPCATTTYTLTASGPGGSATRTARVTVAAPTLEPACTGASCGAASGTTHSGSGIGVWRFRNTTACPASLDFRLGGVAAGMEGLLLFSNGTASPVTTLPSPGILATPPVAALRFETPLDVDPADLARDRWHESLLEENRQLGLSLASLAARAPPAGPRALAAASPAPVVLGDSRDWRENTTSPPPTYATFARAICTLPGGRRAVFWVDPAAETAGSMTADDLAYFRTTFCGASGEEANGGFARVRALMGEPWGAVPPSLAGALVSDAAGLQDINLVFLQVPVVQGKPKVWAGYFYGLNNFLRSADPQYAWSNEALAFFIDAAQVHLSPTSRSYLASALLHELTHMVNFYQRSVLRDVANDTWLEETTATMIEDVVVPVATPDHTTIIPLQRIRPYVASGGGITYTGWLFPDQNSYALGGAFGAFVNRRHGTSILSGTTTCATGGIACVDGLIRAAGGEGFADDFARMGASIFGLFPAAAIPEGFGYPARVTGAYTLAAIDVSAFAASRKGTATALTLDFPASTHTYQLDTVPAGRTDYARTGVVVPAGTSLHVVVR